MDHGEVRSLQWKRRQIVRSDVIAKVCEMSSTPPAKNECRQRFPHVVIPTGDAGETGTVRDSYTSLCRLISSTSKAGVTPGPAFDDAFMSPFDVCRRKLMLPRLFILRRPLVGLSNGGGTGISRRDGGMISLISGLLRVMCFHSRAIFSSVLELL